MTAEEFLKEILDMKHIPLSLTLSSKNLIFLLEEYHNSFSGQPEHTEPPLELRICTTCGKEFKSNINNPICPSCYL
ncbi:MAG: hypothetical protein KA807_16360 [Prolixibacteraceae bacterium]|nr:hypothetical protein [Prolixibacteraceae bacterium]